MKTTLSIRKIRQPEPVTLVRGGSRNFQYDGNGPKHLLERANFSNAAYFFLVNPLRLIKLTIFIKFAQTTDGVMKSFVFPSPPIGPQAVIE